MITLLTGRNNKEKVNRLVVLANEQFKTVDENCIYISKRSRVIYDLCYYIRVVSIADFAFEGSFSSDELFGFINGMIAMNENLRIIYIENPGIDRIPSFLENFRKSQRETILKFLYA